MSTESTQTTAAGGARPFVDVVDLRVSFRTDDGLVHAVDGVSFSVERGRTLAVVGESGSGKSVTSQAFLGLHTGANAEVSGEIHIGDHQVVGLPDAQMRRLRGREVAMIFQDPLSSLHPFYSVGDQIVEAYRVHNDVSKKAARERAVDMLHRVGIPNAASRFSDYPHQFSGGMRQRAMIAMALVCDPALLIADEPTTALDVTVQAQILDLINSLRDEFNSAVIMITHDLGVVAETADDVVVMYAGRCVEQASVRDLFNEPRMPYTWGLLASMPRLDRVRSARLEPIPGSPPSLITLPQGCAFAPRCRFSVPPVQERCLVERPELLDIGGGHRTRCHIDPEERARIWEQDIVPELGS